MVTFHKSEVGLGHCDVLPSYMSFIVCVFIHFFFLPLFVNREDLKGKENRVQERRRQITEACGENDYNTTKELIKNNIDSLQE